MSFLTWRLSVSLRRLFSQTETLELLLLYIRGEEEEEEEGVLHALSDDGDDVKGRPASFSVFTFLFPCGDRDDLHPPPVLWSV